MMILIDLVQFLVFAYIFTSLFFPIVNAPPPQIEPKTSAPGEIEPVYYGAMAILFTMLTYAIYTLLGRSADDPYDTDNLMCETPEETSTKA